MTKKEIKELKNQINFRNINSEFSSISYKMDIREKNKIQRWIMWIDKTYRLGFTILIPENISYLIEYLDYIE